MDKKFFDMISGMSKEERGAFFLENKTEILSSDALDDVNGGLAAQGNGQNTNSEVPYTLCWFSSRGFICQGRVVCE